MACYNINVLKDRGIAQLVEQRSPKPRAEGSNPSAPATDLARNSLEFRAFLVFWWWYAVCGTALFCAHFAVSSHLVPFVSNLSIWHIINKSSKNWGGLLCAGLLLLKIEPICYSL